MLFTVLGRYITQPIIYYSILYINLIAPNTVNDPSTKSMAERQAHVKQLL